MSGGRLVVMDRLGRDVKVYPLEAGLATIGSDAVCDIRVMLPTVSPHHATVVVHANQTVVRSVSAGETLVNGSAVSVAALRHRDVITVGDRSLRWEYNEPDTPRPLAPHSALVRRGTRTHTRSRRRVTVPAARAVIVPPHRASMPSTSSGKQVAIVQPQRRDTSEQNAVEASSSSSKRLRVSRNEEQDSIDEADSSKRKSSSRGSPKVNLHDTTKASLWIESRKTPRRQGNSPRQAAKPTNLRLAVLRKSQSEKTLRVTKIQAPHQIDHTKQAAIMLMTGHTPKSKQTSPKEKLPSLILTKRSTVNKMSLRRSYIGLTPKRASTFSSRSSTGTNKSINVTDISTLQNTRRSARKTSLKSLVLPSPKKSVLKDPFTRKSIRKSESIKFDLSNLENNQDRSLDVLLATDNTKSDDMTLRYDESPSPRRSIYSRSQKILEKALDNTFTKSSTSERSITETYSVVDLVTIESGSIYDSADSNNTSVTYNTPQTINRKTRSNIMLGTSTPYRKSTTSEKLDSSPNTSQSTINDNSRMSTRRSASMTTPENTQKNISFNSTRISKIRSRSRINDSDVLLLDDDDSPRSSRRNKSNISSPVPKNISITDTDSPSTGMVTPENRQSPTEATTPVLSIQSLLDQSALSQSSSTSNQSQSQSRTRVNLKRKTIGGSVKDSKNSKLSAKSRSLSLTSRRSLRRRHSSTDSIENQSSQDDEKVVTPKSAVKLVLEDVKNKHSTAKKTTSKRSIIDDLNESDFVKQLFNSPVKRKLSRSMTEFSRRQLFEDEGNAPARQTRHTIAFTATTPDNSLLNETEAFTPEVFVSPLSTPGNSPNLSGINRLFRKNTPDNDLGNVRGVKTLLASPRTRRSVRNDLTNVVGVKKMFGRSPRNRLSDVRVKELFAASPKNDLRRVSGVRNLFKNSPRNDIRNVSGVKKTLRVNSPKNDLTDVRGVKRLYRELEDRNNLSDVSGVEELFNESTDRSNLDSTFDQLMGKPKVRSYAKSKSLNLSIKHSKPACATKSLHDSYSLISNNLEEWLESELKKRTKSHDSITPKKSLAKSNLTRELQKLTTNTIQGNTPLRTSRVRGSKKSASEVYSEHTLPIKKRSLVEVRSSSNANERQHNRLPIKKRTVMHSTPVKGTGNMTINASVLGRVSPIAMLDKTNEVTAAITQPFLESTRGTKVRETVKRRGLPDIPNTEVLLEPKRTRNKTLVQKPQAVETRARVKRGRKPNESLNAKKRRSSLAITKKKIILKPNKLEKQKENVEVSKSPVKTRTTRRKQIEESVPQAQLAKTRSTRQHLRVSFVATKVSPKVKPAKRANKDTNNTTGVPAAVKTRAARKVTINTPNDNKTVENQTKKRKTVNKSDAKDVPTSSTNVQDKVTQTRGRITRGQTEVEAKPGNTANKRTRGKSEKQNVENAELPKKKTRKTVERKQDSVETKTRGRKTNNTVNPDSNATKNVGKKMKPVEASTKRRRGKTNEKQDSSVEVNTRKTVKEAEVVPTRGRKVAAAATAAATTEAPKRNGRKRKITEEPASKDVVEAKKRRATRAVAQTETAVGQQSGRATRRMRTRQ